MNRIVGALALTLAWMGSGQQPASALSLTERAGEAFLVGTLEAGDEDDFRQFLARPRAAPLKVLYLNSHGGSVRAGIEIGRMVRQAGLATAVDASRGVCDSACTLVFVGGVRRHYVNGDSVHEGMSSMSGLGFHPASRRGDRTRPSMLHEGGSSMLRAHYSVMGAPRAAELMDKAAINTLFRPSGRTSLDLRIATSLSPP